MFIVLVMFCTKWLLVIRCTSQSVILFLHLALMLFVSVFFLPGGVWNDS